MTHKDISKSPHESNLQFAALEKIKQKSSGMLIYVSIRKFRR